jgi:hypothetical protein
LIGVFQVGAADVRPTTIFRTTSETVAMTDRAALQKTDEDVRNDVMRKVKEHDLPIDPKQITVQRMNTPGHVGDLRSGRLFGDRQSAGLLLRYALHSRSSGNKGF